MNPTVLRSGWHPCVECGNTPSAKWKDLADVWLCRRCAHEACKGGCEESK